MATVFVFPYPPAMFVRNCTWIAGSSKAQGRQLFWSKIFSDEECLKWKCKQPSHVTWWPPCQHHPTVAVWSIWKTQFYLTVIILFTNRGVYIGRQVKPQGKELRPLLTNFSKHEVCMHLRTSSETPCIWHKKLPKSLAYYNSKTTFTGRSLGRLHWDNSY